MTAVAPFSATPCDDDDDTRDAGVVEQDDLFGTEELLAPDHAAIGPDQLAGFVVGVAAVLIGPGLPVADPRVHALAAALALPASAELLGPVAKVRQTR
jgi:hypothetical protein